MIVVSSANIRSLIHFLRPHLVLPVCLGVCDPLTEGSQQNEPGVLEWRMFGMMLLNTKLKSTNLILPYIPDMDLPYIPDSSILSNKFVTIRTTDLKSFKPEIHMYKYIGQGHAHHFSTVS